jgi:uncharacterized membrane protein
MNYNIKKEWPLLAILMIPFIAAILIYPHLPEQVPIHWNIQGEADNFGSRAFGAFFLPVLNIVMYLLFIFLPKLDPKRANYSKFESSYRTIRYALHIFFLLLFGATIAAALGYPVDIGKWVPAGVALLFIVMGNIMGRVRYNYFVGFRLPWTLASEEVWRRTHRFGSGLMVVGGVIAFFGVIFTRETAAFVILMAGIFVPIIITAVYSYVIYKRI